MFPKVSRALSRFLEPLKPVSRPGQSVSFTKTEKSEDGGHGALNYEKQASTASPEPNEEKSEKEPENSTISLDPQVSPEPKSKKPSGLEFQPGLTQVILELNSSRKEMVSGEAIDHYETGIKEQKSGTKLPKGSMLDKKAV